LTEAGTSAAAEPDAVVEVPVVEVDAVVDVEAGVEAVVEGVGADVEAFNFDCDELLLPQPVTATTQSSVSGAASRPFLHVTIRLLPVLRHPGKGSIGKPIKPGEYL
jgi:hypothetical protein